jgi:hypothetical protein
MLVSYINAQSWDHFPDLLQRKFVGFSLFKMSLSNPDKELIQTRILKLATAYNTGDIDTALSVFVDDGLDYSDYGTCLYPLFVPLSPPRSHPHTIPTALTEVLVQRRQRTQHAQTRIQNLSPINVHRSPQLKNYHRLCIWK